MEDLQLVVKNLKILYLSEYLFLINTKKKIGKFSIKNFSSFLIKRYDHIFSTINKKNLISINVFKNAGFKKMRYKKKNTLFLYKN